MAADSPDGEPFVSSAAQENWFPAGVSREHTSLGNLFDGNARSEIWPCKRGTFSTHAATGWDLVTVQAVPVNVCCGP